jgi:hypothetical protein
MRQWAVEARLLYWSVKLALLLLVACLALLIGGGTASGIQPARIFLAWLIIRGLLPLLAGILAAQGASPELVRELHSTMPIPFRCVLLMRLAIIAGVYGISVIILYIFARLLAIWPLAIPGISRPLSDLVNIIGCLMVLGWCMVVGWSATVLLRSSAAGRVLLSLVWFCMLVASAIAMSPKAWWLLQIGLLLSGGLGLWWAWRSLYEPVNDWPAQGEWE